MIQWTEEELRKVHLITLEILIEIDRICRKYDIKYSITGGTLLGAVRHEGFIPWDDDADVSMLRSEYIRFREVCETDLDKSKFYFQDIETTDGYRWGYGKIRRKDSLFLRENQENMPYEQGIFIDIFPRDGIPDGMISRKLHYLCCFVLRKALWSEVGKKTEENPFVRFIYTQMAKIPLNTMRAAYRKLIKWSNRKKRKKVRALTFPLPKGTDGYDSSWYRSYKNIQFNGHTLMAEAFYIEWLKREFGNYMIIPPKEKQKTHPVSAIKLPMEYSN